MISVFEELFKIKNNIQLVENLYYETEIECDNLIPLIQLIPIFPKIIFEDRKGLLKVGIGISSSTFGFEFYIGRYNWNQNLPIEHNDIPEKFSPLIQIQQTDLTSYTLRWNTSVHFGLSKPNIDITSKNQMRNTQFSPSFEDWNKMLKKIPWGSLKKIVPARLCKIEFSNSIDTFSMFKNIKTNGHYNFLIQVDDDCTFLGSSPERLLYVEKDILQTEAIAGTRSIENSQELLSSKKDLYEHNLVVIDISNRLSDIVETFEKSEFPFLLKTKNLCHLKTEFKAKLLSIPIVKCIERLSPTSAICGLPYENALTAIQSHEAFQRGFYSAPIGYVDSSGADICVAIRSAYIKNSMIELFSGVGVVPTSNPQDEWNELDIKIKPYMDFIENKITQKI